MVLLKYYLIVNIGLNEIIIASALTNDGKAFKPHAMISPD